MTDKYNCRTKNASPFRITLALALAAGCCAAADLLVLADGESLTGQTNRIDEGILVFRTSLAGQMMVPVDTIAHLSTGNNLILTLRDNQILYGRLAAKHDQPGLQPIDGGPWRPIDIAQIAEAMPIPSPPQSALDSPGAMDAWKTSLETGYLHRSGNKTYGDAFTRAELSRTGKQTGFHAELFMERANPDRFPRVLRGETELYGTGTGPVQPFAALQAERDIDAALDLRTGLTLGLRKNVRAPGTQSIEASAGLNAAYEEWDAAPLTDHPWGQDNAKTGTELNLHLGLRYARALWANVTFTGDITLLPALTDPGAFRARSEAAIQVPVFKRLELRLNVLINYDNAPEFRQLDRFDAAVGAGIHMDF